MSEEVVQTAYRRMTDEEVEQLARDLVTNRVFMSDQCRRPEDVGLAFPILSFLEKQDVDKMVKDGIVHVYEYTSAAVSGRSINGYPMFFSCRSLNKADYDRVCAVEKRMREALANVRAKESHA
jgi:hypothetical protein